MRNDFAFAQRTRNLVAAFILTISLAPSICAAATLQSGASSRATRIRFKGGAVSAQVRGQLVRGRNTESFYVVKAKAGDHMIVNIIPITPGLATSGDVTSPTGKQDGQHGGLVFNDDLTESGDYKIRVARNLMATRRGDGAFILEVVITPSYLKN